MKRREFLGAGIGLAAAGSAGGAVAHTAGWDARIPDYDMPDDFLPQEVEADADYRPYEIHVDPANFALFWVLPDGKAIRYTVGIGRPGLYEAGEFFVGAKREWPNWRPTDAMIRREPDRYARFAGGLAGGLHNPLGARALYLFQPGRGDTYLRIHGTNDPSTIAKRVSNGCARLVNDQLIDLYDRVPMDTRVVLHPAD